MISFIDIVLDDSRPKQTVKVGTVAFAKLGAVFHQLLKEFKDIFAFEVEEMPGVSPDLAVHKLVVDPKKKPARQKKRSHGEERSQAAAAEVKKLLDAWFIRQCYYPDWVANVVLVKKSNGSIKPLFKCVTAERGKEILEDLHAGFCGSHIGGKTLAKRARRQGYFWPTLEADALDLVKRCDKCQKFGRLIR